MLTFLISKGANMACFVFLPLNIAIACL